METYGIEKYGITGTTEIVHNPSYELLYNEEDLRNPWFVCRSKFSKI